MITCAVLIAAAAGAWFATGDLRSYNEGVKLLRSGNYTAAAEIFEALPDYKDCTELLSEANYGIACDFMAADELLKAAEGFAALGSYSDSAELMGKCYYSLANSERLSKNYEQAKELYLLAGDYRDAPTQVQRMIYSAGHEAFLEGNYGIAFEIFEQLDGKQEDYGDPHFMTLSDAADYLDEQADALNPQIRFHIAEEIGEHFYYAIENYHFSQSDSVTYYEKDKLVTMSVQNYFTGDIILDAWENGDTSKLTEDENKVLELALELIEQAKAETDSELELEMWLHDWLCQQVYYESPDMDIKIRDYMELRELTCIGAMLDGKANCQGYTDAFYLLGNMAGFEVRRLVGSAGGGHIWNLIKFDNRWYIVDVTFDDLSDEDYDGWRYTYFNVPWDYQTYEIYGGAEVVPELTTYYNEDICYFAETGSRFTDMKSACKHLIDSYDGRGSWSYVMLDGALSDWDAFDKEFVSLYNKSDIETTCVVWYEYYNGNTYFTVYWE